jgi:hypothetical protein
VDLDEGALQRGQLPQLLDQGALAVLGLLQGALDVVLDAFAVDRDPLLPRPVEPDAPALDLDDQYALVGVGDDEVGLAVAQRPVGPKAVQLADVVEDVPALRQLAVERVVQSYLSPVAPVVTAFLVD